MSNGLLGRDREAEALDAVLATAGQSTMALALIEGEAGIGKRAAWSPKARRRAERAGFQLLSGDSYELERDRPFGAVADAQCLPDDNVHHDKPLCSLSADAH